MTPWIAPPGTAGLIFDCDGTLADTMPSHYRAWVKILGEYGIPFPEDRFYSLGGMPTSKIIQLLSGEQGIVIDDLDALVHAKESAYVEFMSEIRIIEQVAAIARANRGKLPQAVASGGYREVVKQTLVQIGIGDWFDAIVCAEDTAKHKPEPDVFLEAARRLGVDPVKCVVFEDTDLGMEAARRAGMIGVDVRKEFGVGPNL
jgi:HAD superfamily hydrolase (TIGR01549 family)